MVCANSMNVSVEFLLCTYRAGLTADLAIRTTILGVITINTFLLYNMCLPWSLQKPLSSSKDIHWASYTVCFHSVSVSPLCADCCLNQQPLSIGSYIVYEITVIVELYTAATTTWTGSATVNSHILRMETVVRSIWVSWAGGQPWFRTKAVDIVQPDWSACGPKPAEQNTQYYGYASLHLLDWKWHHIALYPGSFSQESKWAWV